MFLYCKSSNSLISNDRSSLFTSSHPTPYQNTCTFLLHQIPSHSFLVSSSSTIASLLCIHFSTAPHTASVSSHNARIASHRNTLLDLPYLGIHPRHILISPSLCSSALLLPSYPLSSTLLPCFPLNDCLSFNPW